jgi:hypothetical protein
MLLHEAVKIAAISLRDPRRISNTRLIREGHAMKRSRRVVLTLMGSAAISAVSAKLVLARPVTCGPGREVERDPYGLPICRATTGGFGGSIAYFHGHSHGQFGAGS